MASQHLVQIHVHIFIHPTPTQTTPPTPVPVLNPLGDFFIVYYTDLFIVFLDNFMTREAAFSHFKSCSSKTKSPSAIYQN